MAEAAVESPASRFFCHKCTQEICPVLPDFICPRCQSGFIEELAQGVQEAAEESDEEIDPSIQFAELWGDLLQDIFRRVEPEHLPQHPYHQHMADSSENGDPSQPPGMEAGQNPNDNQVHPSLVRYLRRRRQRQRGRDTMQPRNSAAAIPLGGGLPQLLASLAENRGLLTQGGGFPIFLNLHGNPGDYAWGRGGLDAVITQLLNQLDGTGPPPLPKEKIEEIPTVEITKEQVEKTLQCTVCMEDFKVSEPVKRLACQHHFHRDCIIPWLELHGTCPICRKLLLDESSLPSSPPPNNNMDAPGTSGGNNRSSDSTSNNSRSSSHYTSSILDFLDGYN